MGLPTDGRACDAFHLHQEDHKDREILDRIFKAGEKARRAGTSICDNPYAPGTEERDEWDAGWRATVEVDEDDSDTGYQRN